MLGVLIGSVGFAVRTQAQDFRGISNWKYLPSQTQLVEDSQKPGLEQKVLLGAMRERKRKKGTSDEGEARMVIAQICKNKKMRYCAYHYALSTAQDFPGSMPALWALTLLDELVKEGPITETEIKKLVNTGSFKEVPEDLIPMVSYYVAVGNNEKKLTTWISPFLQKMGEHNFWSLRWNYQTALEELRRKNSPDATSKKLEALLEKTAGDEKLAWLQEQIQWQQARLKFELADYDGALKLYEQFNASGRWMGLAKREQAWVHYWRGDYADTLGILEALKAPFFSASTDPEQYLLEMLTFRKLCFFGSTKTPAAEFQARYKKALEHVRERKNLSDNADLTRLSFMKASMMSEVETVTMIRDESKNLSQYGLPTALRRELEFVYKRAEIQKRQDLEILLKEDLPIEAARLLDLDNQIQLVDYLSGLDAFRIQQDYGKTDYQAPSAVSGDYRTLYWPARGDEFWYDELKNYRVLVHDRCSGRGQK